MVVGVVVLVVRVAASGSCLFKTVGGDGKEGGNRGATTLLVVVTCWVLLYLVLHLSASMLWLFFLSRIEFVPPKRRWRARYSAREEGFRRPLLLLLQEKFLPSLALLLLQLLLLLLLLLSVQSFLWMRITPTCSREAGTPAADDDDAKTWIFLVSPTLSMLKVVCLVMRFISWIM